MKKIISSLLSRVQEEGFQRYFKNTSWLFLEKALRLVSGLVVGVLVARYLGPEQFGILNYAMSFVAIFLVFSSLGLDSIVVKFVVAKSEDPNVIMGTAFLLRLMASVIVFIAVIVAVLINKNPPDQNLIIIIIAAAAFFQSFFVIDYYFQAVVEARYIVYANIISLVLTALFKIYLIFTGGALMYFALAFTLEAMFVSFGLLYFYFFRDLNPFRWKFDLSFAKTLLKQSWPLILAGVVITVYMKVDQIMIKTMLSAEANGNYAAAVRISETWYFIPMVICSSLFPAIINAKSRGAKLYHQRLQDLFDLMVGIALLVAIPITFISEPLILILFGEDYREAASVLTIHVWAGVFVTLGVSSSLWLVNENLQRLSFYRSLIGVIVNIILNFLFIPRYGIQGAAFTTLFSQFAATYLFDLFHPKTRHNFVMKTKAILLISPTTKLIKTLKRR